MERRTFIAAVPVAPTDPLIALWAERQRAMAAWENEVDTNPKATNWDTPKALKSEQEYVDAEEALCSTPATTIEGLVAQLEYAQSEFSRDLKHTWAKPYGNMFDTLLAGAKQLAGAQT